MKFARTTVVALSLSLSLFAVGVGCNTVRGLGEDTKATANATEKAITGKDPATKPAK
jgi:predicted small secreted protein